jgi:heptose I phosphotransferase
VATYQPLVREIGLDADSIFEREDIRPWRTLPDRENCILDASTAGGTSVRLHVKRFKTSGAEDEVRGIELLQRAGIPTVPLVGWGSLTDGRSFIVTLDLAGYRDSEKLVEAGGQFANLLEPTAHLAAKLHDAHLHHRDLYLCHFFSKLDGPRPELALIDAARVKPLPKWFAQRWIVKDLAQFWYSTTNLPVSDEERAAWLEYYAKKRGILDTTTLRRAIVRKSNWIARHDERLRQKQPTRNVSLPTEGPPA